VRGVGREGIGIERYKMETTKLIIGLLTLLFCISVYYIGLFQTTMHSIVIAAIAGIVIKLQENK